MPACIVVALLVLLQGGYSPLVSCAVCVASCAAALAMELLGRKGVFRRGAASQLRPWAKRARALGLAPRVSVGSLAAFAIAALYGLSALVHGPTTTMALETSRWFALAGMALWCGFPKRGGKRAVLDALAASGCVLAAGGIAAFAFCAVSGETLGGMVDAGRLMFTFGYANAAGIYFGVSAMLCLSSGCRWLNGAAIIPLVALVLTKSVGSLCVTVIALVVWAHFHGTALNRALAGCGIAAAAAFPIAFPSRVSQAAQTFIERTVQMMDSSTLLAGSPLLGIGPDQWQFAYPLVQTAQYRAAVVHSSYAQIALDAGALAAVGVIVACVFGIGRLVRIRDHASALCAAMVCAHAAFDFDMRFTCITLLAIVLFSLPSEGEGARFIQKPGEGAQFVQGSGEGDSVDQGTGEGGHASTLRFLGAWRVPACLLMTAVTLIVSVGGLYAGTEFGAVQRLAASPGSEAAREAASAVEDSSLMRDDPLARLAVAGALYGAEDYADCLAVCDEGPGALENAVLYRVASLVEQGDGEAAADALSAALEAQPYNIVLYDMAREFIVESGSCAELASAYDVQVARANALIGQGHAAWLANQREAVPIG